MRYYPLALVSLCLLFSACSGPLTSQEVVKPNVIIIMADDMGYECLGVNGSTEYHTPHLDAIANSGMRFTHCISQPLCTPSRVKIMTGQYNYRNYEHFTYLNPNQKTFGHLMQEHGYQTCIVGKWQLSGLTYELPGYQDSLRPHQMGFDSYCLWQLNHLKKKGERFADPLLQENGVTLPRDPDAYGPDIVSNHALQFIDQHHDEPFFIYYPMLLTHGPFVPTPDSEEWSNSENRYKADTAFFADMVTYTDKIVGNIVAKLEAHGILENTLLIFTGDNGNHVSLNSQTATGKIQGAKGNTIDHGTHVPMVVSWPAKISTASVSSELVGFADFYATLADVNGVSVSSDGRSLLPILEGKAPEKRQSLFVHYDPLWSANVNAYRNQFARTQRYKLYQDGGFYDIENDVMEKYSLVNLTSEQRAIKEILQREIDQAPAWK